MHFVFIFALLLGTGWLSRIIVPILIGFAGAPGAFIAWHSDPNKPHGTRWFVGGAVCVLGQSLVAVCYALLVAAFIRVNEDGSIVLRLLLYAVGFFVALAPLRSAALDSAHTARENPEVLSQSVQHVALSFAFWFAPLAYILGLVFSIWTNAGFRT